MPWESFLPFQKYPVVGPFDEVVTEQVALLPVVERDDSGAGDADDIHAPKCSQYAFEPTGWAQHVIIDEDEDFTLRILRPLVPECRKLAFLLD
mgnify:CR=1 FL=1